MSQGDLGTALAALAPSHVAQVLVSLLLLLLLLLLRAAACACASGSPKLGLDGGRQAGRLFLQPLCCGKGAASLSTLPPQHLEIRLRGAASRPACAPSQHLPSAPGAPALPVLPEMRRSGLCNLSSRVLPMAASCRIASQAGNLTVRGAQARQRGACIATWSRALPPSWTAAM